MSHLDKIINEIPEIPYDPLQMTILFGNMSYNIRNHKNFDTEFCIIIHYLFSIMKHYDIDINHAWQKWYSKAQQKKYT